MSPGNTRARLWISLAPVFLFPVFLFMGACARPGAVGAGGVLVSEFMALNTSTLRDEDGDFSDWIELYNDGPATELRGWSLTNDAEHSRKWLLPPVQLDAGAFLLVFASGKDRRSVWSELHTDFKLGRSGEYLALLRPDGTVATDFAPRYPEQEADASYGFSMGGEGPEASAITNGERRFLEEPTPSAANDKGGWDAVTDDPAILPASRTFSGKLTIGFFGSTPRARIHYTLNGDAPDSDSTLYTAPFVIKESTRLQARNFEPGRAPSRVVRATYLAVDEELEDFDSDLPVILIRTPLKSVPGNFVAMDFQLMNAGRNRRNSLVGEPKTVATGVIRRRGPASHRGFKKSYALEFRDERGDDVNVKLLGLPAESDWILQSADEFDRTLLRNAFMYELSRRIGRYAPRTRFVEVFLHHGDGEVSRVDYLGLYCFMEKIKRGKKRVDLGKPQATGADSLHGGHLFKIDRPDQRDLGFEAGGHTILHVYPKEVSVTHEQRAWARAFFNDFDATLSDRAPSGSDPARFIDVDSWIDYQLLNELAKNPDGAWQNTYFSIPHGSKIAMGPIWGFERSLAPDDDARARDPRGWTGARESGWWGALLRNEEFHQAYVERWRELRRDLLSNRNMRAILDAMAEEIREAQERNFERWPDVHPGPDGWRIGQVERLAIWLGERAEWMDGRL